MLFKNSFDVIINIFINESKNVDENREITFINERSSKKRRNSIMIV